MRAKLTILSIIAVVTILLSCSKERNDLLVEPTALKFTQKELIQSSDFKYKYTMLKYNRSWYGKTVNGTQEKYTDVLSYVVYSNQDKPMNRWIGYTEWMSNLSIVTFDDNKVDSMPYFKSMGMTEVELLSL